MINPVTCPNATHENDYFRDLLHCMGSIETNLSRVNSLSSYITNTPISLINFLDDNYQYTVSRCGIWNSLRLPIDQSVCKVTLDSDEMLVIPDTTLHPATRELTSLREQSIQFYTGIPIPNKMGKSFATLCVMDYRKRQLTRGQTKALHIIADQLQYRIESLIHERDQQEMRRLLEKKEVLFYEIHHRIKNNLADICGMLQIERLDSEDATLQEILSLTESRISAAAKLHEVLYESEDLVYTNLKEYVERLMKTILHTSTHRRVSVSYSLDIENIRLNISQSFSLGLILNELITNTLKHAFHERDQGFISIHIRENGNGTIQFRYHDNGIGLNLGGTSLSDYGNLGFTLMDLLRQQLNSTISITSGNGSTVDLEFPNELLH